MMDVVEATRILRKEFAVWENRLNRVFLARHSLLVDKPPKDFGSRLQHRLRQFLVFIYLVPPRVVRRAWLPTLKHSSSAPDARALLIWALGMERDSLRNACLGFQRFLAGRQDLAPVLVTDVADFAWFSRLGWMVEYLPELEGKGLPYQERKRDYLAWRYRDAVVVPAAAGLLDEENWNRLLQME
ncbi:MAG: hypothetical protein JNIBNLAF_00874 [Nitrosomonas europaea]|uniref:hypothetical protein n=2 Tax=Nitrosomonas europaea TaxID=915 RepID=UPI00079365B9|nr:hypothetical protein [Nitrosomonas europaea]KXK44501.1 MAG: hypothetical protein UZ02_AOB001001100 [Nitrosomonas europaea]MBV6389259.1 hypothetical protein [Nitrosomonas europaea]